MRRSSRIARKATFAFGISFVAYLTGCKRDPALQERKFIQSGMRFETQGKPREAAIQFSNAIQIDQNSSEAHYQLGRVSFAMGDLPGAYRELQHAVALNRANLQAHVQLGLVLLEVGAPIQRAVDECQTALTTDANMASAYDLLARINLRKGNRAQALKDVQRAILLDPRESSFRTTQAFVAITAPRDGDQEAKSDLNTAITLDAHNAPAHLLLSDILEREGDFSGAVNHARAAVDSSPLSLNARIVLSQLYVRAGEKANAERTLTQAAEDFQNDEKAAGLLSQFYLQTGQESRAQAAYADLSSKCPQSVPLQIQYARILIANNKLDEAEKVVAHLNETSGTLPQVGMLRALLLIHLGKADQALVVLQEAVLNSPDSDDLTLLLARTAASAGKLSLAEVSFMKIQRKDPGNLEALSGLAGLAERRKSNQLLEQLAYQALKSHPHFSDAYLWRGSAEMQQTRYAEAEADLRDVLKDKADSADANRLLGELRLRQNRPAEAMAFLERALAADPGSMEALTLLVAQDVRAGQEGKGVARVERQIALLPGNPRLYSFLASVQFADKNFFDARQSARHAMELDSSDVTALQIYTRCEIALNDTAGAISTWTLWLRSHPNDARAMTVLGMLEEARGDQDAAMNHYKMAIRTDSGQALAANNLAYLMVEKGQDIPTALALAKTARLALPNSASTADTLGWVYYHQQAYASARDLLEAAAKSDPQSRATQYHLGMTYLKLNEPAKAAPHLKKATEQTKISDASGSHVHP